MEVNSGFGHMIEIFFKRMLDYLALLWCRKFFD